MPHERIIIGCMTGTSLDGLDVAGVGIIGSGLSMRVRFLKQLSAPLDQIGEWLRRFASGEPASAESVAQTALDFGRLHADAVRTLAASIGPVDLISIHGQTVIHRPPVSWQLINPWPIARAAGCPVVSDLRAADLAAGGQGAPITPLADWILFRSAASSRVIVNLGGFCNMTLLPVDQGVTSAQHVRGMDVCACNHVLDATARRVLHAPYDRNGEEAMRGTPHAESVRELANVLIAQRAQGRSLGTGDESAAWVERSATRLSPADAVASACEGVATAIVAALPVGAEVLCAGGGVHNRRLMGAIARGFGSPIGTTDILGIPASARECVEMGVLGTLCADGVAITIPGITGVSSPAPIAGTWTNLRGVPLGGPMTPA